MENNDSVKALYVIVNAGFADEVIDIMREAGASGATIINARGEGIAHKMFMGITVDSEKELVLTIAKKNVACKIMKLIKTKAGLDTPIHGICFVIPVENVIGLGNVVVEFQKA